MRQLLRGGKQQKHQCRRWRLSSQVPLWAHPAPGSEALNSPLPHPRSVWSPSPVAVTHQMFASPPVGTWLPFQAV